MLTTYVHVPTGQTDFICPKCQALDATDDLKSPDEMDKAIAELEAISKNLESIISRMPEMPDVPKGLESFAFTPLSMYKSVQESLAALRTRRVELMTRQGSTERLNYELRQAVERGDFEEAAKIRDALTGK